MNWVVIAAYFVLTLWLGERVSRRGGDLDEYFLAGRGMPWWAAALSIVGTETSTLTFVGVPAIAYAGDLTFLQVAMGYVVGRFMVAWWLVPAYFTGHVRTAYEILDERFGPASRRVASSASRSSDGSVVVARTTLSTAADARSRRAICITMGRPFRSASTLSGSRADPRRA